ncbi:site-specific integrase [Parashewanella curva]|uniref:Site-specific integrase n=1 Tax=Parashewanella curva TaxID=2338552 RepID=A0A3L8Q1I6_9GAMM|nr:site-specific integrase [Parashewanella curva]RLV60172.1 site-specific integrase [Parashewanella curva]
MIIKREYIKYKHSLTGLLCSHHILYIDDEEIFLLSHVNIYLSEKCSSSKNTSSRYSRVLQNFFTFLVESTNKDNLIPEIFLLGTESKLKEWQIKRIYNRNLNDLKRPSEKTIYNDACLVHDFYYWLKNNGYHSPINVTSKKWIANFKSENDLLSYTHKHQKNIKENKTIKALSRRVQTNTSEKNILSIEEIKKALSLYNDHVYPLLFKFCSFTGLRPSEVVQFPYHGTGLNSHISSWQNMEKIYHNETNFIFNVEGKGNKLRKVKINCSEFASLYSLYQPHLIKRRKLYRKKYNKECPLNILWLNKTGTPVTSKMISDRSYSVNKKLDFNFEFYDSRHWYATMFMVIHLKNTNGELAYNSAVEQALMNQIGHESIVTTYQHYISKAQLYLEYMKKDPRVGELYSSQELLSLLD